MVTPVSVTGFCAANKALLRSCVAHYSAVAECPIFFQGGVLTFWRIVVYWTQPESRIAVLYGLDFPRRSGASVFDSSEERGEEAGSTE